MVSVFLCLSLSLFSHFEAPVPLSSPLTHSYPPLARVLAFSSFALSRLITITTPAGSIFWFDTLGNREQQLTAVIHCPLLCSLVA